MSEFPYGIELTRAATKDLLKLRQWRAEIEQALHHLANDPTAGDTLSGALSQCRVVKVRLKGSGEGRIAYTIHEFDRVCIVFAIDHRENFYSLATRRYEFLDE